jgi:acyl-[acyl-carrier-protein]-phospholipid O-acyltransferase/long-chain-fatty-acid--[acyl-carrier-protein] ligase
MSTSPFSLLRTRRLWPLALSQSCGAFNDSMVKNAMVILALFSLGEGGAGLSALAGVLFILPYVLLSATAGQIADRFSKPRVIITAKAAETVLMCAAAVAFMLQSVPGLMAVVAGLGLQATLFGPVKYGVLPEHLAENELVAGNGMIEATSFVSIVAGTIVGGALVLMPHGTALVAGAGVAVSLAGLASAAFMPRVPAACPSLQVNLNIVAATWSVLRHASSNRAVWLSIMGLSWFWTVGATLLTEFPLVARDTLSASGSVLTLLLGVFAVGVGLGSILCARLLKGEVSPRLVPFAALGISLFCWDFASACNAGAHYGLHSAADVVSSFQGVRMMADLLLLAACGGMFSVPLYAIIQERSDPSARSRTIAANNVMNALFMVAGSAAAAGMAWAGMRAPEVLRVAAAANLLATLWIVRILPQEVMRSLFRLYFNLFHGVEVHGLQNYRAAGDKVVIVSNHLSFADACLIACYLPDSPTFAVHTRTADFWWAKPFLAAVDIFRVDIQSPFSIKRMVEAVRDDGRKLMIFPEGRLTKTGSLMKVYEGAGVVAERSGAMVLPISIEGLQFTRLGRMKGKLPMRWFPRLSVNVMPPVSLSPAGVADMTPRQRREAVGRGLQDLMVKTVYQAKNTERTLFSAFLDARQTYGGKTLIAEDANRQPISYDRLTLGAALLGRKLAKLAMEQARTTGILATDGDAPTLEESDIGLMLPNSNGTLVAFMGLQAFGLTPCMLNFSAGADGMLSACRAARVRTVVSSRAFVDKGKLTATVDRMSAEVHFVWLEDVRASAGLLDKLRAKLDVLWARSLPGAKASPDSWAAVLFTSGSEGMPKGVVHSHRSLLSNLAQLSSVIDFNASDRVFNAMPVFHSFGLTGGTLLPLLFGVRTFHYPSPLHYRIVPSLIYDTDATIAFGTDTFLNGWAKFAHPYDFYSMRYIFGGAEKIRDETRRLYAERFGVRLLEGYGATETAPALAINTAMHSKAGTVGRFLPGISYRLEDVPGIEDAGRLYVRGPNLMLGYLKASSPGVLELCSGEYDTGDIVAVDDKGYISIKARAKRFAKIAGEMVSMTAAETLVASVWPEDQHAVVSVPDARKGEALLLVTTRADADTKQILLQARERGVAEISVPRAVMAIPSMPLLGTGKVDYPAVAKLVAARSVAAETVTSPEVEEDVHSDASE